MLKTLLIKTLISESNKIYKEYNSEIVDIIVFGSLMRGKDKPNDIDLIILFKNKKNLDISYQLKKEIEKKTEIPINVESKLYSNLFQTSFQAREALLAEGYSLLNKTGIANGLGYENLVMFIYNLKGKNKSERMRFYYSLHGRGMDGMLKILKANKITDTVIMCPVATKEEMKEYLENWKIEFKEIPVLIPTRLA